MVATFVPEDVYLSLRAPLVVEECAGVVPVAELERGKSGAGTGDFVSADGATSIAGVDHGTLVDDRERLRGVGRLQIVHLTGSGFVKNPAEVHVERDYCSMGARGKGHEEHCRQEEEPLHADPSPPTEDVETVLRFACLSYKRLAGTL
jgi:hypothetical protein